LPSAGDPLQTIVPWESGTLRPLFESLLEGAEEARVEGRRVKATAVGLPDKDIKDILSDARYPATAKRALVLAGPNATVKVLNDFGISGKYSDAAIAGTALVAILLQSRRSDAKFNELIEEYKKSKEPAAVGEVKKS
jgi:hypothetical protein